MVEIPDNIHKIRELKLEPSVLQMTSVRVPLEIVLLASIAVSLRKIAKDKED